MSYEKFLLAVSRAQSRIWAGSTATFPFGREALQTEVKIIILSLTSEIEKHINSLEINDRRKKVLHKKLEDFRREINQPNTGIGSAPTSLAQISAVVAMTTTTLTQGPVAYLTIQNILGAEKISATSPEIQLIEEEKKLLLAPPVRQIEGPQP